MNSTDFNPKEFWRDKWLNSGRSSELFNFDDHLAQSKEFMLPRKLWCNLNRIRTGHGRCNEMLFKWKLVDDPSCACGEPHQTTNHMLMNCPIFKYNGDLNDFKVLSEREQALTWLNGLNL